MSIFSKSPSVPPFAIGCEDAGSGGLAVITMLDPRTVDLAASRPNGDPFWVVRDIVYGLDEARCEVAMPRSNAMTVDVMPADRADAFVLYVVERMHDPDAYGHKQHGMAWDFLCEQPAVRCIVNDWREAEFSARITVEAARRWMETAFDVVGNTNRGTLAVTTDDGRAIQFLSVNLASGCDVWIASEGEALNHLRSMLAMMLHDYPREKWCVVLRVPIMTDRHGNRFKAAVRFMVVPREHSARFVDGVELRSEVRPGYSEHDVDGIRTVARSS